MEERISDGPQPYPNIWELGFPCRRKHDLSCEHWTLTFIPLKHNLYSNCESGVRESFIAFHIPKKGREDCSKRSRLNVSITVCILVFFKLDKLTLKYVRMIIFRTFWFFLRTPNPLTRNSFLNVELYSSSQCNLFVLYMCVRIRCTVFHNWMYKLC